MRDRKRGNIINIAALGAWLTLPKGGAYCIAKAGVVMLTKSLAQELANYNIRVNAIAPGMIKTDMTVPLLSEPETLKRFESRILLGRVGEPSEIASAALFLASDASSYITGHTIVADCGTLIM